MTDGLKKRAKWRKNPFKRYIPLDADGAYRVEHRLDGLTPAEVWKMAEKRKG